MDQSIQELYILKEDIRTSVNDFGHGIYDRVGEVLNKDIEDVIERLEIKTVF